MTVFLTGDAMLPKWCCVDCGLPRTPTSRELPSYNNNSVPGFETVCRHHAVMVIPKHSCGRTFYRPDALPVARPTASKHWRTFYESSCHSCQTFVSICVVHLFFYFSVILAFGLTIALFVRLLCITMQWTGLQFLFQWSLLYFVVFKYCFSHHKQPNLIFL